MRERERYRPPTEGWRRTMIGDYIIEYRYDSYKGGLCESDRKDIEELLIEGYADEGELSPRKTHRGWWRKLARARSRRNPQVNLTEKVLIDQNIRLQIDETVEKLKIARNSIHRFNLDTMLELQHELRHIISILNEVLNF